MSGSKQLRITLAAGLVLGALVSQSTASAGEPRVPNVAAQLSGKGLSFVAAQAKARVPRSFSHPTYRRVLVDCPFTSNDTVLSLSGTKTMLLVRNLLVFTDGPRVVVLLKADVSGFSYLKITRPYACVGYPLSCRMDYTADKVVATASFQPRLVGGKLELVSPRVQVSVAPSRLRAGVTGCGLAGDLVNLALPPVKAFLQGELQRRIARAIEDKVGPQVAAMLGDLGAGGSTTVDGYRLDASLVDLRASRDGLFVGARLDVQATTKGSCVEESVPAITPNAAPRIGSHHGQHLGISVSEAAISSAVQAAWRSGMLCLSSEQLAANGITHELPALAAFLLGLSGSAPMSLWTPHAPTLRLLPSESGARVRMTLPGLELHITGQGPSGATRVAATGDAIFDLELGLDAKTRNVVVVKANGELAGLKLTADKPEGLRLEQTMLLKLLKGLISSLVKTKLTGLAVTPQVLRQRGGLLDGFLLDLRRARTSAEHLYLYVDLFAVPAWDSRRPDTGFAKRPPARTSQQVFTIEAHGVDDQTPSSLLRYRFRVDGGAWSETSYAASHTVELAEGAHRVEVRAVDQNDNVDASPALIEVTVDANAPVGNWGKGDDPGTLAAEEDAAGGCTVAGGRTAQGGLALVFLALLALFSARRRR